MGLFSKEDAIVQPQVELDTAKLPQHVAIIMDGNGRWAKQQGKLRTFGHKAGVEAVRASVRFARTQGIPALTLFAFSSENWKRPQDEVSVLMELFKIVLHSEVKKLHKNGVRLKVIGDLAAFDADLVAKIRAAEAMTADNTELTLNIAANYGGRWDIVEACKRIQDKVSVGELQRNDINEHVFAQETSFAHVPELDLLIRTGGEQRISNFLLWQCAYAEFYFTDVLWPDFNEQEFAQAVYDYQSRQRRFGKIAEQL
jgi:undecaprenyl diphosphate synthase